MRSGRLILALLLLSAGCARAASAPPSPSPSQRTGDPELYAILDTVPLDSAAGVALQNYELALTERAFLEAIAEVAADPAAGTPARFNAVQLLGERAAAEHTPALHEALGDRDPRVRAAAVVAAGLILEKSKSAEGLAVVLAALDDRAPEVQAKALEVLGTSDLAALRSFLERHPQGEPAAIARGLLQAGEDRGAPLPADSAGVLRRVTAGGIALEFRPTQRWPEWQAAVGTVTIRGRTSPAFTVDSVEAVAGVVPVFFAPDESAVVYERGRQIYVRDLRRGEVRLVGSGIAPRPLPFTTDFVYMRLDTLRGGELREQYKLRYDVLRAGFVPQKDDPRYLGNILASAEMKLHGNYSPMRWLQVVERKARFTLEGEGAETFRLPDPFHAGSVP